VSCSYCFALWLHLLKIVIIASTFQCTCCFQITDFGACRPVTNDAEQQLKQSERILETIRNGDWKEEAPGTTSALLQAQLDAIAATSAAAADAKDSKDSDGQSKAAADKASSSVSKIDADADRLEGTPAYLPPEVLRQRVRYPGYAADAWALGCLAYFCLHGRPKYFGDTEQVHSDSVATVCSSLFISSRNCFCCSLFC
jgi:serine/threonine protein kinase